MEGKISTENARKIAEQIEYEEKFKKSYYHKKANVWEKYGKRRLYVPRNAYEDVGYIDLDTREIHPTRPGNASVLKNVLSMIEELEDA